MPIHKKLALAATISCAGGSALGEASVSYELEKLQLEVTSALNFIRVSQAVAKMIKGQRSSNKIQRNCWHTSGKTGCVKQSW